MCGIAAIAGHSVGLKFYQTEAMLWKLKQRGPDGEGQLHFTNCWLGHRRLSIIDLHTGAQPMQDGDLAITFNGEIYNHKQLRACLEAEGHCFITRSDTEVILKAYRKWGNETPKYLDGMFAFAIWDNQKREMFLARDRFGKKPLYYLLDGEVLLAASEIKALLASGTLTPEVDYGALDDYLRLMYVPPWKSIYKDIKQIPPAHRGIYKDGKMSLERYWHLPRRPISISYEDAKTEILRLLRNAVNRRLSNADVEVGAFLSGGVDSSLVAFLAAEQLEKPLKAFSVSYAHIDELSFARQVSEKLLCELSTVSIVKALTNELEEVIGYFDEPHADTSNFSQHLISKLAAEKVKVVLSGDGADELFLGYKWHTQKDCGKQGDLFHERLSSICAFSNTLRERLWQQPYATNSEIHSLYGVSCEDNMGSIDRVTIFDISYHLPGQILAKVDRAGMMHGLEVRSPFLDTELAEFIFSLPYEFKVKNGMQKLVLRDLLSEYMPRDFAFRPKQGFGAPIANWLHDPTMKAFVYSKIGSRSRIEHIFSRAEINRYLNDFYAKETFHPRAPQRIWVILCLEIWLDQVGAIG